MSVTTEVLEAMLTEAREQRDAAIKERDERDRALNAYPAGARIVELATSNAKLIKENRVLRERVAGFFDAIAHGDDEHRRWLKAKIDDYLAADALRDKSTDKENVKR